MYVYVGNWRKRIDKSPIRRSTDGKGKRTTTAAKDYQAKEGNRERSKENSANKPRDSSKSKEDTNCQEGPKGRGWESQRADDKRHAESHSVRTVLNSTLTKISFLLWSQNAYFVTTQALMWPRVRIRVMS